MGERGEEGKRVRGGGALRREKGPVDPFQPPTPEATAEGRGVYRSFGGGGGTPLRF